jgi:WD40 repeat protein
VDTDRDAFAVREEDSDGGNGDGDGDVDPSAGTSTAEGTRGHATVVKSLHLRDATLWYMRLAVSPDGSVVAAGTDKGIIYLWSTDEGTEARLRVPLTPGQEPDADRDLEVLAPALPLAQLQHPRCARPVRQVSFTRDGTTLCAVSDDSTLWRWDLT